ncbi:major facilitator superfamily domain-containing protein [Armillaria borealis]|uniref:Major facilitator superfamily domain-containing protein n=1 Tax=Armillaria borealis TaxID=47425 RepID=A0AA39JBN4_9AGAR|nr:major facilitator superfamily domain-containing protein [Armillaria borealis]
MSQEQVDSDVEARVSPNDLPEVQATEKMLAPSAECVSIYSYKETWFIVGIIALAGFASPFPATIYFPAIPRLTEIFHESTDRLNLTLTIFLVPQAACPMLWGPFSDRYGRRPCIILCFVILILSCIGLALTPTNAFWLLLLLRCIQSAGCTGTLALGAGAIADITTRADRGTFFGAFNAGPMLAPGIGPVIGGLLSQYLGWRAIFWFLTIFSSVSLLIILAFLPETLPCIVGNGSIRPSFIYQALIPVVGKDRIAENPQLVYKPPPKPFRNPFLLFLNPDVLVATLFTSVIFSMQYSISGTLSNAYTSQYPFLNSANIGLCYLPNGLGLAGGTIINGKLLDAEYRRSRARAIREAAEKGISEEDAVSRANFPIERARLQMTPFMVLLFSGCVFGWGWCVDRSVSLAGPLLLQIALGFSSICVLNATTTLMIDLFPDQSSAVTACTNFFRSAFAAILVALQEKAIKKLGYGLTFVIFGCICASMVPLVLLELKIGPTFRSRRVSKAS